MPSKSSAIAEILGIRIEQVKGQPWWVRSHGDIIRQYGPCAGVNRVPLEKCVQLAIQESDLNETCLHLVLPMASPRGPIYAEIEGETLRQSLRDGEKMAEAIADKDPRDAINIMMSQIRSTALALADATQLVQEFQRCAIVSVAAYEWAINWFAGLQIITLDKTNIIPIDEQKK